MLQSVAVIQSCKESNSIPLPTIINVKSLVVIVKTISPNDLLENVGFYDKTDLGLDDFYCHCCSKAKGFQNSNCLILGMSFLSLCQEKGRYMYKPPYLYYYVSWLKYEKFCSEPIIFITGLFKCMPTGIILVSSER